MLGKLNQWPSLCLSNSRFAPNHANSPPLSPIVIILTRRSRQPPITGTLCDFCASFSHRPIILRRRVFILSVVLILALYWGRQQQQQGKYCACWPAAWNILVKRQEVYQVRKRTLLDGQLMEPAGWPLTLQRDQISAVFYLVRVGVLLSPYICHCWLSQLGCSLTKARR